MAPASTQFTRIDQGQDQAEEVDGSGADCAPQGFGPKRRSAATSREGVVEFTRPSTDQTIVVKSTGIGHKTFEATHADWLLYGRSISSEWDIETRPYLDSQTPRSVGVSVSLTRRGQIEAIALCRHRRVLLLHLGDEYRSVPAKQKFDFLASILPVRQLLRHAGVRLIAFDGVTTALLLFRAIGSHNTLIDLGSLPISYSNDLQLAGKLLGAEQINTVLQADLAMETAAKKAAALPATLDESIRLSHSAFLADYPALRELKPKELATEHLAQPELRFLGSAAGYLRATRQLNPESRKVEYDEATLQGSVLVVRNRRYQTRLARDATQRLLVRTTKDRAFNGQVTDVEGKLSKIRIEGIREQGGLQPGEEIVDITVLGQGELSQDEAVRVRYWRTLLAGQGDFDRSGLTHLILGGKGPTCSPNMYEAIRLPWKRGQDRGEGKRLSCLDQENLNPSQMAAAEAILAPLDDDAQNRIVLVHGPPGTGKTTVIAAAAKQYLDWQKEARRGQHGECDAVYAVCHSNSGVRNLAESLTKKGVDFKILVSDTFFVEWHEHQYGSLESRLLLTNDLPEELNDRDMAERLGTSRVILCTTSSLASNRFSRRGSSGLFDLRRMSLLLVDEASQIPIGAFPNVFDEHASCLGRVAFFGDDKQLAPYGADIFDSTAAELTIFDYEHVRSKALLLDTSYRLPKPLASFIGSHVYGGKLRSTPQKEDPMLGGDDPQSCLCLVDCYLGREARVGHSWKNEEEVRLITMLVEGFYRGTDFRVLTLYDAQRDEIEKALRTEKLPWKDRVYTVDSFQGQECDVVLLSLVRTDPSSIGFLRNDRRSNVMLTRSKEVLVLVTNKAFLTSARASKTLVGKLADELWTQRAEGVEIWREPWQLEDEEAMMPFPHPLLPARLFVGFPQ